MNEDARDADAWFAGIDVGDVDAGVAAIRDGRAEGPRDWPRIAVETGFVPDADAYYEALHEVTLAAARRGAAERERADDQQVIHAVRALDDSERTANELAERLAEWAGSRYEEVPTGVAGARDIVAGEVGPGGGAVTDSPGETDPADDRVRALATRVCDLADEADDIRGFLDRTMPTVAPNLTALAGPVLAARLVAHAGGLEDLAKLPSGTVQVLGAEDALFAHLQGGAPSPKHGVIYLHEAVRHTRREDRGSAARALAGKLSIAARIDHYSGERRPDLDDQLAARIDRIRARADDGGDGPADTDDGDAPADTDDGVAHGGQE